MKFVRISMWMLVLLGLVLPLAAEKELQVQVKAAKANVRKTPAVGAEVVREVPGGTVLTVLEKSGEWYKVQVPPMGVEPAVKGYIHANLVTALSGAPVAPTVNPPPATPPAVKPPPPARKAKPEVKPVPKEQPPLTPKPRKESRSVRPHKRFFLRAEYLMGNQEDSVSSTLTGTVYQEPASFNVGYTFKKGNSIDAAFGFRIAGNFAVELGGATCSRDISAAYGASIPHPLLFNKPRTASGTAEETLTEAVVYLNLVYMARFGKLGLDLYAGPAYLMGKVKLITNLYYTDAYPFATVTLTPEADDFFKGAFGFDVGARLGYYFGDSVGLVVDARYMNGKVEYDLKDSDPETALPNVSIKLGGFKVGAGLKVMF